MRAAGWLVALSLALPQPAAAVDRPWPTVDWPVSAPEAEGVDSTALASLIDFGAASEMDSLLVARHGSIVLEAHYAPFRAGMRHAVHSATKGVIGTLAGIALHQGLLPRLDQPIVELFGDRRIASLDERKKAITVQHLLDMTSGIDWQEPLSGAPRTAIEMERSADWQQFVLDRPMARAPGEAFDYNSGNSQLLSALVGRVAGRSARGYAEEALFKPLGIRDLAWRQDPQGVSTGGYGLYLQPRDMAKIGHLYLRDGVWDGRRLLPRGWVDSIRGSLIDMRLGGVTPFRYANGWWVLPEYGAYMAAGYHRQLIVVMPALDAVAVTTGRGNFSFVELMKGLRAAMRSDSPLPANPKGEALLARHVEEATAERRSPVRPAPDLGRAVSRRWFRFEPNALGVQSLQLDLEAAEGSYQIELEPLRPGLPPRRLRGAIGLDGLFRVGEASSGYTAVKGTWTGDDTFVLLFRFVVEGGSSSYLLRFGDPRSVEVQFENAWGERTVLRGVGEGP
ncbi:serine hydrolase [Piscinibacter sp. XHJ-5]|uniref:serine hydrolase domain-containing protein n=1 Tax=Piscinibacter sp. XHJ-5 TaxID=3037797 RepID=UPI0024529D47|nr:serine hydrolase [Piscinibacter sp. XHJ-5]